MSIQSTNPSTDITDRTSRNLGNVNVTGSQDEENYLPFTLAELKRISLILAEIGSLDINDFDDIEDEEVDI